MIEALQLPFAIIAAIHQFALCITANGWNTDTLTVHYLFV